MKHNYKDDRSAVSLSHESDDDDQLFIRPRSLLLWMLGLLIPFRACFIRIPSRDLLHFLSVPGMKRPRLNTGRVMSWQLWKKTKKTMVWLSRRNVRTKEKRKITTNERNKWSRKKEKYALLSPGLLAASYGRLLEDTRGVKWRQRSCVCDLILLVSPLDLLFTSSSAKPWGVLAFQE